jgi:hypothetical protein
MDSNFVHQVKPMRMHLSNNRRVFMTANVANGGMSLRERMLHAGLFELIAVMVFAPLITWVRGHAEIRRKFIHLVCRVMFLKDIFYRKGWGCTNFCVTG